MRCGSVEYRDTSSICLFSGPNRSSDASWMVVPFHRLSYYSPQIFDFGVWTCCFCCGASSISSLRLVKRRDLSCVDRQQYVIPMFIIDLSGEACRSYNAMRTNVVIRL